MALDLGSTAIVVMHGSDKQNQQLVAKLKTALPTASGIIPQPHKLNLIKIR